MSSKALVPLNALASAAAPSLPTLRAGDLYFNTTSNTLFSYTGSAWVSASGGGISSITAGTGLSGGTITTSGTIAIDSTVATLTGTQTLTNKTLTSPTLTTPNIGVASGTSFSGFLTSTNTGKTGNVGLITPAASSQATWSGYPVGYAVMVAPSANGAPNSTSYFYFLKVANRDSSGGWSGIAIDFFNGDIYSGLAQDSSVYATWYKMAQTSSPTLITPNIGVATGTSFNSITGLSSTTPIVNGTAAVGTGTTTARGDHVHPTDTSRFAVAGGAMTGRVDGSPTSAGVTILNSNDNGNFSVRSIASNATSPASMSFHRPGIYAINMGLDTDNNFKIGGWSAGIIMLTVTPAGNLTVPGTINATGAITGSTLNGTLNSTGAGTAASINASGPLTWEVGSLGAITSRVKTGAYENSAPTVAGGWPADSSWYHLISATHSNTANYYAAQYASSFFNSEDLWYRSTNGGGSTVWNRVLQSTIQRAEKTASYTLVAQDVGRLIEMGVASANTVTVPLNSSVAFPLGAQINILQTGAGQTTIAGATAGVIINGTGTKLRTQWSSATLIKRGTDTWVLIGDIS
jgi:hypothetical protein